MYLQMRNTCPEIRTGPLLYFVKSYYAACCTAGEHYIFSIFFIRAACADREFSIRIDLLEKFCKAVCELINLILIFSIACFNFLIGEIIVIADNKCVYLGKSVDYLLIFGEFLGSKCVLDYLVIKV